MSAIITVENLSKKYIIGHQRQERYTALRDVLANGVKRTVGRLLHPRAKQDDPEHEEFWALKDVNFEIQQGDRVGIIGRNGAGKSTLLKILSRITEPTSGRINLRGRVASLLEVGTGFHPELTGRENVYLNGAILGMSKSEINRKFDEIVAFAEVEKFLDTPVKRYSSGMYVRLAFAVAAHLEPEILIVDEVLAVGDAQFQKKCMGKMEQVGVEGRTVLFVSHNMAAIETLCQSVIYLNKGMLVGQGEVNEQLVNYMAGLRDISQISLSKIVNLGDGVSLTKLEISPNPIESGKPAEFQIEIESEKPVSVNALTILFFSSMGSRVAVVDLRNPDGENHLIGERGRFRVTGTIASLPFVEGEYSVGLFFAGGNHMGNHMNLLNLTVLPRTNTNLVIPYPANVRGVINLDHHIIQKDVMSLVSV